MTYQTTGLNLLSLESFIYKDSVVIRKGNFKMRIASLNLLFLSDMRRKGCESYCFQEDNLYKIPTF